MSALTLGEAIDRLSIESRRLVELELQPARDNAGIVSARERIAAAVKRLIVPNDEPEQEELASAHVWRHYRLAAVNNALWERENQVRAWNRLIEVGELSASEHYQLQTYREISRLNSMRAGLIAEIDGTVPEKIYR